MEIRIVIFLAFVSVTLITNTLVILLAYRALAGMTAKLTSAMAELGTSSETRELMDGLQAVSQRAASVTESAKLKMAALDPTLVRFQETYRHKLAYADSKLEDAAKNINTTAQNVRDMVAKPVFAAASFSAGFIKVLRNG
jgi:phosphoenolpyruvate carboxylase